MTQLISPRQRWRPTSENFDDAPQIDRSVVLGLSASFAIIILAALLGGNPTHFVSFSGFLLVLGGTLASTMVQFSLDDIRRALRSAEAAMFLRYESTSERVRYLVHLSRRMKEDGVLVLEQEASQTTDSFLRLGLEIVVDGQQPEEIKRILQNEMRSTSERAWRSVHVWETMGNFAPALGLIGTLIGLINMLSALQDASTVGSGMSLALVATLYGAVSANLIFFPLAGKLRSIAREREHIKDVTLEGLLSIARSESPIVLEQKLQSFTALAANG